MYLCVYVKFLFAYKNCGNCFLDRDRIKLKRIEKFRTEKKKETGVELNFEKRPTVLNF